MTVASWNRWVIFLKPIGYLPSSFALSFVWARNKSSNFMNSLIHRFINLLTYIIATRRWYVSDNFVVILPFPSHSIRFWCFFFLRFNGHSRNIAKFLSNMYYENIINLLRVVVDFCAEKDNNDDDDDDIFCLDICPMEFRFAIVYNYHIAKCLLEKKVEIWFRSAFNFDPRQSMKIKSRDIHKKQTPKLNKYVQTLAKWNVDCLCFLNKNCVFILFFSVDRTCNNNKVKFTAIAYSLHST